MPIPKYDEMYRAFLDCLADGQLDKDISEKGRPCAKSVTRYLCDYASRQTSPQ